MTERCDFRPKTSHLVCAGFRILRYVMAMTYVLHFAPDNASMIVRLALEELGVPYRCELVDRARKGQRAPGYLALNPNGLIPVLETPSGVIFETGAILLWLADRHGALAPAPDAPERAEFLKWLFYTSNTLHANLRLLFYPRRLVDADPTTLTSSIKPLLDQNFRTLNDHWNAPDQPDITSFYIAACLRWCALYGPEDRGWFDLAAYPNLVEMVARLEPRASVQAAIVAEGLGAHPFTQPVHPNPPIGSAL